MKKRIFTFWEPEEKIPAYLKLCMETWKKFLPDYEIVILNYSNLDEWIGKNHFDKTLYENFSLPKQADAIRCAVLRKHGGVWFDIDTIITSDKIGSLLENKSAETTLIGKHLAFISTEKNSKFLRKWDKILKHKIFEYKLFNKYQKFCLLFLSTKKCLEFTRWDYMGNSIINTLIEQMEGTKYLNILDKMKLFAFPELNYFPNFDEKEKYKRFYFDLNDCSDYILDNEQGIILLHNSWTPLVYKHLEKEDFLKDNCTCAQLIKKVLEK